MQSGAERALNIAAKVGIERRARFVFFLSRGRGEAKAILVVLFSSFSLGFEGAAAARLSRTKNPSFCFFSLFPTFHENNKNKSILPSFSGRVDATKELDDFSLTASLTDATAKDLDNAPHLRDALITARTKKDGTNLLVGYDAGQRGALAGLTTATELAGKAVDLGATWFQNGNHVRGEARVQIDDSQSLWATKTLNDDNDVGNATVVNLAERKAFVIEPFNIPVSTAAVKYSIEREGYTVEPAYDLNTKGKEKGDEREKREKKFFCFLEREEEFFLFFLRSPSLFCFASFFLSLLLRLFFPLSSSFLLLLLVPSSSTHNSLSFLSNHSKKKKKKKLLGAFLSVTKAHDKFTFRPQYAFADEVALLEVAYDDGNDAGRPLVRAYAKAPAGPKVGFVLLPFLVERKRERGSEGGGDKEKKLTLLTLLLIFENISQKKQGFGPVQLGVIADKAWEF